MASDWNLAKPASLVSRSYMAHLKIGIHVETLPVHLFKSSFGPFLELLNENGIKYNMREVRIGVPMASSGTLEIIKVISDATFWPAVAAVIVAFINRRNGRKVIITIKDRTVLHVEELSLAELGKMLQLADSIMAIDPNANKESNSGAAET